MIYKHNQTPLFADNCLLGDYQLKKPILKEEDWKKFINDVNGIFLDAKEIHLEDTATNWVDRGKWLRDSFGTDQNSIGGVKSSSGRQFWRLTKENNGIESLIDW